MGSTTHYTHRKRQLHAQTYTNPYYTLGGSNTMTCNYNEYMLHEIQQTLSLLPDLPEYNELRCDLKKQREELLEQLSSKW